MMEQMVNSIIAHITDLWPVQAVYRDEIPEEPKIPSMYVPGVLGGGEDMSKDKYLETYDVHIKLFGESTVQATQTAHMLARSIRSRNMSIPLRDVAGSVIFENLRFTSVSVRPLPDDNAELYVIWQLPVAYKN